MHTLNNNTVELQAILDAVNALPEAGSGDTQEITLQDKSVTPSKAVQEVTADNGYDGLSKVTVGAIPSEYIIPSGTLDITVNGTYDVTDKASVNVAVPEREIILQDKTVTENGIYYADDGYDGLGQVTVEVPSSGGSSDLASILFAEKTFIEHNIAEIPADGFRGWQFVEKIDMPNVTGIGQYACYNCVGLKEIDFPLCETIGNYAFYNNTDVVSVNMPALKTTGTNALRQLTSLVNVCLPSLTAINGTVFQKCTLLEKADFSVVKSVGANAFNGCSALTALILRGDTQITLANVNALNGTPIADGTGFVYFNRSRVESQKAMTNWSTYAAQIRAIEDYPEITGG